MTRDEFNAPKTLRTKGRSKNEPATKISIQIQSNSTSETNMKTRMLAATALALVAVGAPAMADVPETRKPIKFAVGDWTGSFLTTGIARGVLEDMGYRTEEIVADSAAWYPAMGTGDMDVAIEVWLTTQADMVNAAIEKGTVESLGESGLQAVETWWYPSYLKEKCPGLPDYKALNDCVAVFATPETGDKGRYLSGPVTWGGNDEERIAALGLNYTVVYPGTDAAMFAELESAYSRKAPILMWLYSPHWAPSKYEGEFIQFPEYSAECATDPAWGTNPDMVYDCDKPRGPIIKTSATAARETWPCAIQTLEKMTLTNQEYGDLWAKVDLEGMDVDDVVQGWLEANQERWKSWQACS